MTEGAPAAMSKRIQRGLRSEPSLEGGLRAGSGFRGEEGIAPVLILYLCRVGGVEVSNWGKSTGFTAGETPGAGAGDVGGGCVPWAGGEGLTRGLKDALCPPLVIAMAED